MRAMYTGKEGEVLIWGLTFPRGDAVEIPADNAHARAKVIQHPEFVVEPDTTKPEPKKK
jgi:hypothetical protein